MKLLGPVEVLDAAGDPSPLQRSEKGLALLTYLVVTGAPQNRETIADLLWSASSTGQSLQNLRKLLSRLRKWVPTLEVTRKRVELRRETFASVDYLELSTALDSNDLDTKEAGLKLYRGQLLDTLYLADAPFFNEWLTIEREKLRQRVIGGYRQLCNHHTDSSRASAGIDVSRAWLTLDPFSEEALRQLLTFFAADGQVDAALEQYAASRQQLWDELGVEPESQTMALVTQLQELQRSPATLWSSISNGADATAWPARDELVQPGDLPPTSLVPFSRNDSFIARRFALLQLADALLPWPDEPAQARAVSVTGMGGVGKTQLAVEFCYRYGRFFSGGVFWLNFGNPDSVSDEIAVIGGERGMRLFQSSDRLSLQAKVDRVLRAWQDPTPRLVIFDNCESEALFREWAPVSGGTRILITSLRDQWSPELEIEQLPLQVLSRQDSVQLLTTRSPELNGDVAANIAAEIGDLPLALHLAGSFLARYQHIAPSQYLAQLRTGGGLQHPSLQGRGTEYSPTQHQLDIARSFDLIVAQLDRNSEVDALAHRLLTHAAYFAPGEPVPRELLMSTVMVDESDFMGSMLAADGLMRLANLGLLTRDSGRTMTMHRLVSQFVRDQVADERKFRLPVIRVLTEQLQLEFLRHAYLGDLPLAASHIRTVVMDGLKHDIPEIVTLSNHWCLHLRDLGQYARSAHVSRLTLRLCEAQFDPSDVRIGHTLYDLGVSQFRIGKNTEAHASLLRCLAIYDAVLPPGHANIGRVHNSLGVMLTTNGELRQARAHLEIALSIWEDVMGTESSRVAITLYNLASLLVDLDELADASRYTERALEIWRKIHGPEHPLTLHAIHNRGLIQSKQGKLETARATFESVLALRTAAIGAKHPKTVTTLHSLGDVLTRLGDYEAAYRCLTDAIERQQTGPQPQHHMLGHIHLSLADWYLLKGDRVKAAEQENLATVVFDHAGVARPTRVPKPPNTESLLAASGETSA